MVSFVAALRCRRHRRGRSAARRRRPGAPEWQEHDKPGLARHRFDPQIAVMPVDDDLPGQIQPQPGPFTEGFGGEERLEDVLEDVGGNSWTGVADLHAQHLVGFAAGTNRQRAARAAHRGNRIVDDVGPHLVQIAWVAGDLRKRVVEFLGHRYVQVAFFAQPVGEHRQCAPQLVMHVGHLERCPIHLGILFGVFHQLRNALTRF